MASPSLFDHTEDKPRRRLAVRQPISSTLAVVVAAVSIIFWLALYQWASNRQTAANEFNTTVPSLLTIFQSFGKLAIPDRYGSIWLWSDCKITAWRLLLGLGLGVVVSVLLGLSMACFGVIHAFLMPLLSPLAKVPQSAMIPILFLFAGTDIWLFVSLIAIGVLPVLSVAVYQMAMYDVPEEFLDKAYTLGASHGEVVWSVIFPQIVPRIIEAVRLQFGSALQFLIAAELFLASEGIGYRLRMFMRRQEMASISAYIIVLVVTGFVIGYALTFLRKWIAPWFDPNK